MLATTHKNTVPIGTKKSCMTLNTLNVENNGGAAHKRPCSISAVNSSKLKEHDPFRCVTVVGSSDGGAGNQDPARFKQKKHVPGLHDV